METRRITLSTIGARRFERLWSVRERWEAQAQALADATWERVEVCAPDGTVLVTMEPTMQHPVRTVR